MLLIPFFQEMVRVDLRIQVIEIPNQDVISRDNVSMKVDAVLYFPMPLDIVKPFLQILEKTAKVTNGAVAASDPLTERPSLDA